MSSRTCPDWPLLMEVAPELQFMHYTVAEAKLPSDVLAELQAVALQDVAVCADLDHNVFYAAHTDPQVAEALRGSHWFELREWSTRGPGSRLRRLVRLDQSGLMREHDRLDAVAQAELLQHVRDVRLDRRLADEQRLADLGVRPALGDQREDLPLPLGQLGEPLRRLGRGRRENWSITRLVTAGESSASPAATVRIAPSSCSGGSSLSTNPLAPARSAS